MNGQTQLQRVEYHLPIPSWRISKMEADKSLRHPWLSRNSWRPTTTGGKPSPEPGVDGRAGRVCDRSCWAPGRAACCIWGTSGMDRCTSRRCWGTCQWHYMTPHNTPPQQSLLCCTTSRGGPGIAPGAPLAVWAACWKTPRNPKGFVFFAGYEDMSYRNLGSHFFIVGSMHRYTWIYWNLWWLILKTNSLSRRLLRSYWQGMTKELLYLWLHFCFLQWKYWLR